MSHHQAGLMPLAFNDNLVRVRQDEQGDPWFVAKDVCAVLGLSNNRKAVASLDEDEKGVTISDTLGGEQEMLTVSESGLYSLIFRSRKPEARAFRRWVTGEVLPSLRKTGSYGQPEEPVMMPGKATLAGLRRVLAVWALLADLPPQALLDQTFAQFGLTEEDEDNPQDALDAALLHALRQNNLLLTQGRKISREALHRYEQGVLGAAEPPVVKLFWRQFRKLNADGHLNHSRNPELIALRLGEVALAAQAQGLYPFSVTELRQQLPKGHTYRLMAASRAVNSVLLGKAVRCMVFFQAEKEAAQGDKEAGNA